jgi:hypothetical protein
VNFSNRIDPASMARASWEWTLVKEAAMGKRTAPNDPPSRPDRPLMTS